MAYQLKTTGIAASCTMAIAVDPDTSTVKDFASSGVTADMTVGANVTIGSQSWDGNTRYYWRLPASPSADADYIKFGTTKPRIALGNSGTTQTIVYIGENAGPDCYALGKDSASYANVRISGNGTTPRCATLCHASVTKSGSRTNLTGGEKIIYGFVSVNSTSLVAYSALDTDSAMTKDTLSAITSTATYDYDLDYLDRRNSGGTGIRNKTHATLLFSTALSESDFDALRDDWFGTLFEPVGGDTTAPVLTSPVGTKTGSTTATVGATTDEGNGTAYAVITTSATQPTDAYIVAGKDHTGASAAWNSGAGKTISATGAFTWSATGLTASTTYYAHVVHHDAAANVSNRVVSSSFTTDAAADVTAPVLTSPVGTKTGTSTATVGATTDEGNGTMYAVVTTSATQPSVAQIKAGQDHTGATAAWSGNQAISSTGAKTFSATGLVAATAYYAHVVHTDAAANDSNRVSSAQFTTDALPGTLTLDPLKNNTGTLLASETGATAHVYATTGALVVSLTGQTTNGSGVMTLTDAAIVAGTSYRVVVVLASGGEGLGTYTAT